jgi:uncharacterized membrane protein
MQDLHPIFVHFPVALIPMAVLLGLWSLVHRNSRGLRHAYRLCLVVGIAFALGAVLSGQQAGERAQTVVPHSLLEAHEELGGLTFWLLLAAGLFELASALPRLAGWAVPVQALAFVIVVTSLITVALAGHRGAEMVYRHGAGVGSVFSPPSTSPDSASVHSPANQSQETE